MKVNGTDIKERPVGPEALAKIAELDAAEKALLKERTDQATSDAAAAADKATQAEETAKGFADRIDAAEATASEAKETANTAKETADAAKATADGIDAKASEALTTANMAKLTADDAKQVAEGLSDKIAVAEQAAVAAEAKAEEAKATADGIDAKATSALDSANAAETLAEQAKTTAEGIDSKASRALSIATSAESNVTAMQTTVSEHTTGIADNAAAIATINGGDAGMSMRDVAAEEAANAVTAAYIVKGSATFEDGKLYQAGEEVTAFKVGWVYNIINDFTTTDDFVDGAGIKVQAGMNIVVAEVSLADTDTLVNAETLTNAETPVKVDLNQEKDPSPYVPPTSVLKFDLLGTMLQLDYATDAEVDAVLEEAYS